MENKNYTIGQEFSITDKTPNQNIVKIKITDIKSTPYGLEYKMTTTFKEEMLDGSFKKSQESEWRNLNGIKHYMVVGNLVEKN